MFSRTCSEKHSEENQKPYKHTPNYKLFEDSNEFNDPQVSRILASKLSPCTPLIQETLAKIENILKEDKEKRKELCYSLQSMANKITDEISQINNVKVFFKYIRKEIMDCIEFIYSENMKRTLNGSKDLSNIHYEFSDDILKTITEPFKDEMINMLRFVQEIINNILSSLKNHEEPIHQNIEKVIEELSSLDKSLLNHYVIPVSSYLEQNQITNYLIDFADILNNMGRMLNAFRTFSTEKSIIAMSFFLHKKEIESEFSSLMVRDNLHLDNLMNKIKLGEADGSHFERVSSILVKIHTILEKILKLHMNNAIELNFEEDFNMLLKPNEVRALETHVRFNSQLINSIK